MKAKVTARICGTREAWSVAEDDDDAHDVKECSIELEIVGDEDHGFHLYMTPKGFSRAHRWFPTREEALEDAREAFGVRQDQWPGW